MSRFRILLSYHYFQTKGDIGSTLDHWFGADTHPEVFADSGAYSALTQGEPISLDRYAKWCQDNRQHFAVYANLDHIGDGDNSAEGTWTNQRRMEDDYGLDPLPVFHAGEPWSALDRYLENGYRYIALGGLVGRPRASIMPWLVQCFRRVEGEAVFHGFGLTSWEPLRALPWFSVDSSSWASGYRYGMIRLWDDSKGRMVNFGFSHADRHQHADLIRSYGFQPSDLEDKTSGLRQRLNVISAGSWRRAETWLRERHGRIVIPGDVDGRPAGLRWYNANSALINLTDAATGIRLYLADTNLNDLATGAAGIPRTRKEGLAQ